MNDEELLHALRSWAGEHRSREAAASRSANRWHMQMAGEEMRLSGLLLDLHDRSETVHISTLNGRTHFGTIAAVGSDFIAIAADERPTMLISFSTVTAVSLPGSGRTFVAPSDRQVDNRAPALADVLWDLANDRTRIRFTVNGSADTRTGEVLAVGNDVVAIAVDSSQNVYFIALSQLGELTLAG